MISVLASEGSAPRGAGTRMLVTGQAQHGTIGGGQLEFRAVEQAHLLREAPAGTWRVQDYPLGPLLGQCCGGRVRLLIEHVDPARLGWLADAPDDGGDGCTLVSTLTATGVDRHVADAAAAAIPTCPSARGDRPGEGATFVEVVGRYRRPLYLFGAGHVGQAIVRHAEHLPFRLAWFDTRPAFTSIDGVAIVADASIERCVEDAPDDAAILILTHDHSLDYRLTRAALRRRQRTAYVGLIGSATKKARFDARLAGDGLCAQTRARLTSPIGLPGMPDKEPDVIAIATLAQLLQLPA
jgi:xanthine dehydrogenase accessory factor